MLTRFAVFCVALLGVSVVAFGAQVTAAKPGSKLNGAELSKVPAALKPGDHLTGPLTVQTAAGGTLDLAAGAEFVVRSPKKDVEQFFLPSGVLRGQIGEKTEIAMPVGWLVVPKGQRATFYAEVSKGLKAFVKVDDGRAGIGYDKFVIALEKGQGILIRSPKEGDLCFATRQDNTSDVGILIHFESGVDIRLTIPKATSGCVEQIMGGTHTKITSDKTSYKGGKIGIHTTVSGAKGQVGSLGPGAFAVINNETGEIQFGFKGVSIEVIHRSVSLTSEFTATATSNFFGIGK